MQCACVILSSVAFPFYSIFPHYLTNGTISEKKVLNTKYFLIFFTTFVWNISHSTKNWAKYNQVYTSLHVKSPLFLSYFNETWISWPNFGKILKYQISWKSVQWESVCSMLTDRHDAANSRFSQFCKRSGRLAPETDFLSFLRPSWPILRITSNNTTTASFHILSNSLFPCHPTSWHFII